MTKIGYKQSAEHKRKRLSQIEGDSNGRWAGGHHPDYYRKKAGAKTNDGTIVHHKNGDRENNKKSNLERLTDGDCVPGRRTTPKHEQITDRTSRKDGTKGKRCPGGYWIPKSKKCASGQTGSTLKQVENFNHRTKEGGTKSAIENIVWPATALAIAGAGVAGLGIAGYAIASGSGKPSGNAEKKQLIKTIVSSEEKKNPEVTIAPPVEKPVAPTPPPVPKNDRPKKGLIRVPKSSGNAEKKKLIETIVKAEEKKRSSSVKQQTKLAEGDGWKLHLSTDDPALVSENLTKMGLKHKTGRNSGQEGKDVTVYVGNGAAAKKAAEAIEKKLGQHLKNPPEGSDTATDDVQVHGKVWGRFALHQDPRFHQYGSKGFPWLNEDMGQYLFIRDPQEKALFKEAANRRALAVLAKDYPEDFAGIDVSIAPAAKKKTAPKPPPAFVKAEAMKRAKLLLLPAPGETTDMPVSPATTRSSTRSRLYVPFGGARISTAPDVEKTLISPSGRQAKRPKGVGIAGDKPYWGSYREEQEKKGRRVYRKRLPKESEVRTRFKKRTDSTIAIRLALKQAV